MLLLFIISLRIILFQVIDGNKINSFFSDILGEFV